MSKNYNSFKFDEDLAEVMAKHNTQVSTNKFTSTDAIIMSLVHSYHSTGNQFFASNEYLASRALVTAPTVQTSINKLCALGFISKKVKYENGVKVRFLIYNEEAVELFKRNGLK